MHIMKPIKSLFVISLFCCGAALSVQAAQQKDDAEQWRIYSETEVAKPNVRAILYSFDGEDGALGLRCENKQLEAYFIFSDRLPAQPGSALIMKADGVGIDSGRWQRSSSGNGAFAIEPGGWVKQLSDKKGLILTYRTEQGQHKVAAFYLNGIDRVVEKMRAVCGITL
jgi:hypothetical protein